MLRTALGLLFALLLANAAAAAPMTYTWNGVVEVPEPGLAGAIHQGDSLHVTYTFDAAPGCPYGCPGITYRPLISGSVSIGPYTYTIADPTVLLVVLDDSTDFPTVEDVYEAQFFTLQGPTQNGLPPYFLELALADVTHTAFPSPTLNFDAFSSSGDRVPGFAFARSFYFYFGVNGATAQAWGGIQSMTIVPEPNALFLACIALVALLLRSSPRRLAAP